MIKQGRLIHLGMRGNVKGTDLAWLAGILDGEGCIMIRLSNEKLKSGGRSKHYTYQIIIYNTNLRIVSKVSSIICDVVGRSPYIGENKNTKNICATVTVRPKDSIKCLLQALLPYLVGKKDQAECLLEALSASDSRNENDKIKIVNIDKISDCYLKIKSMKKNFMTRQDFSSVSSSVSNAV